MDPSTLPDKQRTCPRRHLIFYLRVFDNETNKLVGYIGDISTKGVMLVSEKPIKTDKVFSLSLHLNPTNDRREPRVVNFDARSIWCRNDVNPDLYDTGFELIDLAEETVEEISELIDDIGFNQ